VHRVAIEAFRVSRGFTAAWASRCGGSVATARRQARGVMRRAWSPLAGCGISGSGSRKLGRLPDAAAAFEQALG
jgi:hypothetical protein